MIYKHIFLLVGSLGLILLTISGVVYNIRGRTPNVFFSFILGSLMMGLYILYMAIGLLLYFID